jgi:regulatory protein YycH of two-component signal transduction system YycFG
MTTTQIFLPSEYEKHSGETADPVGREADIEHANQVLLSFFTDMRSGRTPNASLEALSTAFDLIHKYAGYPGEHFAMDDILFSSKGVSYQLICDVLPGCIDELNRMIQTRRQISLAREDDLPF